MGHRRKIAAATGIVSAVLLGGAASAQTPQYGGTAIFTMTADPITFNPSVQTNVADEQVGCIIYPSLIQFDANYKMHPWLAKSWTISPDGLTYTLDLNKAEWHDGKPFTSEDVKYTLEEVSTKLSSVFRRAGEAIAKVEAPARATTMSARAIRAGMSSKNASTTAGQPAAE